MDLNVLAVGVAAEDFKASCPIVGPVSCLAVLIEATVRPVIDMHLPPILISMENSVRKATTLTGLAGTRKSKAADDNIRAEPSSCSALGSHKAWQDSKSESTKEDRFTQLINFLLSSSRT